MSVTPPEEQPCINHCPNIKQGITEGWYPKDLDPYKATETEDLKLILNNFHDDHPHFKLDAARDALDDTREVDRYTMAEALANGLNISYDPSDPLTAAQKLADHGIVYGYNGDPGNVDEEDFGGYNKVTNAQLASFLNRITEYYDGANNNNNNSSSTLRASNTTRNATPTTTAATVDPCQSVLDDLAATVHIVAGASSAPRPENSVGQTQTVVASRLSSSLWLVFTSGPQRGSAVSYGYALDVCDPQTRVQWIWAFSPNWVEVAATCRTRSSCSYRVTDSAAVDQTFRVWATPWAVAQTGVFYGATSSPSQVVTRAAQAP